MRTTPATPALLTELLGLRKLNWVNVCGRREERGERWWAPSLTVGLTKKVYLSVKLKFIINSSVLIKPGPLVRSDLIFRTQFPYPG